MSEVINVAVFPCGSEVGLEVHRALKYYRHFSLIGLSSVEDHGRIAFKNYLGDIPQITESGFIEEIKRVVNKEEINFLIPAMDEVGYLLKQIECDLNCEVVYPEKKTADIIRRKSTTYENLKNVVKLPKIFSRENFTSTILPVFVKPDIGYGSRGARKITDENELQNLSDQLLVMEYLPGEEYTIDCFSSVNGELIFSGARKRSRVRMGISVATETVEDQGIFKKIAEKISIRLGMKGLWFFQLKRDNNGELTLLEVAGRVSGSMALYRGLGINFIAADLFQRIGYDIAFPALSSDKGILERAFDCTLKIPIVYDTVYCDLDDCLIINGKINTNLVRFLYQCLNEDKKIVLLTRHHQVPDITLKKLRLTSIFDEIVHIKDRSVSKATAIDENGKSIFIDDSFAERQSVFKAHNIPTFAPDAIDLLINKSL